MFVRLLCLLCYVGSDLCDDLITRSEESYRVCVKLCDVETPKMWGLDRVGMLPHRKKKKKKEKHLVT